MYSVSRRQFFTLASVACVCVVIAGPAFAQDYPNRPITFVVSNAAGTPTDNVARLFASEMSKLLGQPIIVENKPGANQAIGAEHVAKLAPADGYTFLVVYQTALVTLPSVTKNLRFDPQTDLVPVMGLARERLALWSSSAQPWNTFSEFVKHAKAKPGKLNYGSPSAATRLTMESLIKSPALGLEVVHIPYKGSAPSFQAILAGEVHVGLGALQAAMASGDRVRVLAVTGDTRSPLLPNVPTFAELGYPHVQDVKHVMMVRAGTPKPIVDKAHLAAVNALQRPEVKARMAALGLEAFADTTSEAAAKNIREEFQLFADVAKKIGIEPE